MQHKLDPDMDTATKVHSITVVSGAMKSGHITNHTHMGFIDTKATVLFSFSPLLHLIV